MRAPWRPGSSEETPPRGARSARARTMIALLLLAPWLLAHCGAGADEPCLTSDRAAHVDDGVSCSSGWEVDPYPFERSTAIRMSVRGDNGDFTDTCLDGCGAARQFECEVVPWCSDIDDHCGWAESGQVISKDVLCPCVDGRCLSGCPFSGDPMHVEGVASGKNVTLVDETTGRRYACTPWGCTPEAGAKVSLDRDSGWCTEGKGAFSIGWCLFSDCALLP